MSYTQSATPARDWAPERTVLMGLGWSPAPGQTPADDPRMVRRFATVKATYRPHNVSGTMTTRAADELLAGARALFSGHTVRKIGSNGWTSQGTVGYEIILANATRAGEIKRKNFEVGQQAGPRVGAGVSFDNALTFISPADFEASTAQPEAPIVPPQPGTPPIAPPLPGTPLPGTPLPEAAEPGFFDQEVGGIPMWMLGGLGAVAVTGLGLMLLWPKSSPSTANRRRARRRSRRNARRRTRRGSRRRSRRRRLRHNWSGSVERVTMKDLAHETDRMEAEGGPFTVRYGTEESSGKAYADRWEIGSSGARYEETKYVKSEQEARDIAGRAVMSLRKAGYKAHLGHANIR